MKINANYSHFEIILDHHKVHPHPDFDQAILTWLDCDAMWTNKTLFYLESFNSKLSHKILTVRNLCWKIFIEPRAHAAGWTDRYSVYATKTCSVSTSVWGCYYTNIQVMVWFQLTNNMNVIWCNVFNTWMRMKVF